MEIQKYRLFTRAALLLALTVLFQSLRLIIPLPPLFSTFLIGSLVNACLLIATETAGLKAALAIAIATPIVAWFQQLLPLPVLILPVAIGNVIYVTVYSTIYSNHRWTGLFAAAGAKTLFLYAAFDWLLGFIALPAKVSAGILFVMSWPQFITAILGGIIAAYVSKRVKQSL